ncbi:MAG: hypothetical protein ACRD2E_14700, partial [Terriglobales bacterium]
MPRYLALLPLLALSLAVAPRLAADTITNYTMVGVTGPSGPAFLDSSSFVYDNTTGEFTQASLTWDGLDFNFLPTINDPSMTQGAAGDSILPCLGSLSGGAATLAYMTTCGAEGPGGAAQAWVNEIPLTDAQQETMYIGFSWDAEPEIISGVYAPMSGGTLAEPLTSLIGDDDGGVSMGFTLVDP